MLSNLSENMTSATPGRLTEGSGKVEKTTAGILRPNIVSYKSKYSYDTIGNILTKTQAVNGGESSLSCNDTYTYVGKQPHAVTKAGAMVFTYDDNGNMIKRENTETKNTMTLVWDDENRLIKTTDSLHTTDYRYDANGERIIKKSELGETQYVSANYIVRNKTVISKHIFAGNQRVASTVSMKDNCGTVSEKNTMYFHPDHLGSSSYVTDKKGNFFEMIEYLPYGETLYDEAATVDKTEFRFTSKEQDAETGLYYYGARYRDAKTGVWLSVDPILESYLEGEPNEGIYSSINLNLYHYAGNNPVAYNDPTGMWGEDYHLGHADANNNWDYGTVQVGQDAGFSESEAIEISRACNQVDIDHDPTKKEEQHYHFNTNNDMSDSHWRDHSTSDTELDSRIILSRAHYANAVKLYKKGQALEKNAKNYYDILMAESYKKSGLRELGTGAHPLQDVSAHSDDMVIVLFGHWSHYGPGSGGSDTDNVQVRPNVKIQSDIRTYNYFKEFRKEVGLDQ